MHWSRLLVLSIFLLIALLPIEAAAHLAIITQGPASGGEPQADNLFGSALAVGDFDGDGFDDLAAGAPDDGQGTPAEGYDGALTINYGHPRGLTHVGAQYLTIGDVPDVVARFGKALATGDFNHDGYADLAVGVPDLDHLSVTNAGAVYVYSGSAGGLIPSSPTVFDQASVGEVSEAEDKWGWSLASGDFNDDGYDDLGVGSFNEDGGDGLVSVLYGSISGLTTAGANSFRALDVGSIGIPDMQFGWALAAGNVIGTTHADLIVGAPGEEVIGNLGAGRVYVIPGSSSGLDTSGAWSFDSSDTPQGISPSAPNELGYSLAVASRGPGEDRMTILAGEPAYDGPMVAEPDISSGRVVLVTIGSDSTPSYGYIVRPDFDFMRDPYDRFGEVVAAGDFDQDGDDDYAISGPNIDVMDGEGNTVPDAGKVFISYALGSPSGEDYDPIDLNDRALEANSRIGQALAFGRFDDSGRANLAVGAPLKDYDVWVADRGPDLSNAGQVYVVAPWRQVQGMETRSAIAINCENEVIFSLHPFKRVPLASVTKAMTALLGCEAIENGQDPYAVHTGAAWYHNYLPCNCWPILNGMQTSFIDLLHITLGRSANDASFGVADVLTGPLSWAGDKSSTVADFVDDMNAKAQSLGMFRTIYSNPAGYDAPHYSLGTRPYSTAWDQGILALAVMNNQCESEIVGTDSWNILTFYPAGTLFNIDVLVPRALTNSFKTSFDNWHPQAVGIKGGLTDMAQRTAMYAVRNVGPTEEGIVVGGGFGFETAENRYRQGAKLMNLALETCAEPFPVTLPTEPDPQLPADVYTAIPGCLDEYYEVTVPLKDIAYDPVELLVQPWESQAATVELSMWRRVVATLEYDETIAIGVNRYLDAEGWKITNVGDTAVEVLVESQTPSFSTALIIQPGATTPISFSGSPSEKSNTLSVRNLLGATAHLQIEMVRHLIDGLFVDATTNPSESIQFSRSGGTVLSDELDVIVRGETEGCNEPGGVSVSLSFYAGPGMPTAVPSELPDPRTALVSARLLPNHPNPFNPLTTIHYELLRPSQVQLAIYDLSGRLVRTLVDGTTKAAGTHHTVWNGKDGSGRSVASGVYLVALRDGISELTQKLTLLK